MTIKTGAHLSELEVECGVCHTKQMVKIPKDDFVIAMSNCEKEGCHGSFDAWYDPLWGSYVNRYIDKIKPCGPPITKWSFSDNVSH